MKRRLIAAYTIATGDDPEYDVYTDAYGLEMNIDNELAVDTVLFASLSTVEKITGETEVTSMGTVFAGVADGLDAKSAKKLAGVSWLLIDGNDPSEATKQLSIAAKFKLSALIRCDDKQAVERILSNSEIDGSKVAIAMSKLNTETVSEFRTMFALQINNPEDARILLELELPIAKPAEKIKKLGADGIFVDNGTFDEMLEVLSAIG